ncbi:MAG TPA: S28 family serine protease [Kofleriaceae bacterium]|nr:S28 family serine protease [Kofleriaceae bacterium]
MRTARLPALALAAASAVVGVTALAALPACGGDDSAVPAVDILDQLRAIPQIASVQELQTSQTGYRYFMIQFDQPVDHDHPEGEHFHQMATLIHRDAHAPMMLVHTGYGNWYFDLPVEPTKLLQANQLVVEHRFFRASRPTGSVSDWDDLTIAQAAADHHAIVQALRPLYDGAWIETGASKGGMTSVYHRRFYPDDVDGTLAYVAPISFGAPDYRYDAQIDSVGPPACRQAIRDLQVDLLTNRRQMLIDRTTSQAVARGHSYNRITIPAAVESAVVSLEWSFWQYEGAQSCPTVPPVTASDAQVWAFLDQVSPVSSSSDFDLIEFEAYDFQAEEELGYPGTMDEHLMGLLQFPPEAYDGAYPPGVPIPTYRPEVMPDIDGWVRAHGDRLIFLYGEWDPWSGGKFELGDATDSLRVIAPMAPHGAGLGDLTEPDREAVLVKLADWTGVTPAAPSARVAERTAPGARSAFDGGLRRDLPRPPSAWIRLRLGR